MASTCLSKFQPTRFPATCPKCLQKAGEVRSASTVINKPTVMRLTVRCQPCGCQWVLDTLAETPCSISQLDDLQQ